MTLPPDPPVTAQDHEQQLIDFLIDTDEAVEYGERWTEKTTHEWWIGSDGVRRYRLVQTYHGGGSRGDDDQAEYARRLIDMGRAHPLPLAEYVTELTEEEADRLRFMLPDEITHVIVGEGEQARALRIRRYSPPPEGV